VLHRATFAHARTSRLERIDYVPTTERSSEEFPFILITGRSLYAFNAGTMTARTGNRLLRPTDRLEISSVDAVRLGLSPGQRVRLRSRYGETILPVETSECVKAGELFATFHDAAGGVNRLTSPVRDRRVDAPEYKITAVDLEPLG